MEQLSAISPHFLPCTNFRSAEILRLQGDGCLDSTSAYYIEQFIYNFLAFFVLHDQLPADALLCLE